MFIIQISSFLYWNKEAQPRAILVKFEDQAQREIAIANEVILKVWRIWLDLDFTPLQIEAISNELTKVKETQAVDFVIFLRDNQAIITKSIRQSSS